MTDNRAAAQETFTDFEPYPSPPATEAQVDQIAADHLGAGAVKCTKSKLQGRDGWQLATVWKVLS